MVRSDRECESSVPASRRALSGSSETAVTGALNETTLTLGWKNRVSMGASDSLVPSGVVAGALTLRRERCRNGSGCSIAGRKYSPTQASRKNAYLALGII